VASIEEILSFAKQQLGKPYVFGAAGPDKFDCSGLVQFTWHHFGVELPRTSQEQAKQGSPVATNAIQPGDLVFSDWGDGPNSHVGIAVSGNQIIDAPHTGAVVRYDTLSGGYLSHVTAVRRVGGVNKGTRELSPLDAAIANAGNINPLDRLADAVSGMGSAVASVGKVADLVTKAFIPSNFVRLVAGGAGMIFLLIGVWLLTREVRPV
jgi:hypothetical protein